MARKDTPVELASAHSAETSSRLPEVGFDAGNHTAVDGGTDAKVVASQEAMPVEVAPVPGEGTSRGPVTVRIPAGYVTLRRMVDGDVEGAEPVMLPDVHVKVAAFDMDLTEVTRDQYGQCVAAGVCSPVTFAEERQCGIQEPDHPVCVDHDQARTFCHWAGKRLPTEAEWQHAAQGTDGRNYPWGNRTPAPDLVNACGKECVSSCKHKENGLPCYYPAYKGDDGWPTTAPVGSFRAGRSPFGLYDMAGNVAEWTASCSSPDDATNAKNCEVWAARGGNWASFREDLRVTSRSAGFVGIRCVR